MATTQNTFTGNGSNLGPFSFTFKWLEPTDIKVSVAGVLKTVGTHYNLVGLNYSNKDGGQVAFLPGQAPANGAAIVIYRQTDDSSVSSVFYPGSAIRSQDLNDNFTQGLYVNQEVNNSVAAANTTANTALTNSNTAITTANAATATANTASTNASAAVATANTASTNASAAVSTANIASTNASAAVTTANTASATATTALNTANATAAAQAALEANVYDAAELDAGQLDNRYYTETEIDAQRWNKTTETIASNESWVSNDSTIPTTASVNNRLIDLINDVGAYVVVNSEVTFPNAGIVDAGGAPDSGVLVAVTDATGLTWNGSGVSTNATTSNSTAVTITGITGTSPISNCGMQVLSTSTLHSYTFVRWVVGSNVAQTISDNINEILLVDTNTAAAAASASAAAASASAAGTSATNAASSASAAASSASAASTSASNAATSASNAATSASSAANSATALLTLQYLADWGLITNAAGTTSDYGVLV